MAKIQAKHAAHILAQKNKDRLVFTVGFYRGYNMNFILYIRTSNDCKPNNLLYFANLQDKLSEVYSLSRNFEEIWSNSYDIYYVHCIFLS